MLHKETTVILMILIFLAIVCAVLTDLLNGNIVYASDTTDPFDFGTTATHSCNMGFSLVGGPVRTCDGDGSSINGVFDGTAPTCERKNSLSH